MMANYHYNFFVEAYACIEAIQLIWVQSNQDRFMIELYSGLKDVVMRGYTTPSFSEKRVVLHSSFMGSSRYMIENYQDAMVFCRLAAYPDLFILYLHATLNVPRLKFFYLDH